jgi:VanZ family protein
VPRVGIPHVDKLVHLALYGVLGVLLARPLRQRGGSGASTVAATLLGVAVFAAFDEWHQRWVPGRSGDVADWLADLSGAVIALLVTLRAAPRPASLT